MFNKTKLPQPQRDELEFLTDLNRLLNKWAHRGCDEYAAGIKLLINGFTLPKQITHEPGTDTHTR